MGKIKQGILGGFNGKVGTVVGFSWKGRSVMRAIAQKVSNPKTDKQRTQRQRFQLVGKLVKGMSDAISMGFHPIQGNLTAQNVAMRYNLANAIAGTYPTQTIDYTKVMISRGTLVNGANLKGTSADGMISITWTDNSNIDNALTDDMVAVGVYNTTKSEGLSYATGKITRKNGGMTITLPERWKTDSFAAYISFVRADFSFASDSVYLGSFTD